MTITTKGERIMAPEKKKNTADTPRRPRKSTTAKAVQNIYKRSAPLLICEALLLGAAAILMVFKPIAILTLLTFIIGAVLILFGLYRTIAGFIVPRGQGGGGWIDVVFGLINIVLGVLFCAYPISSIISIVYIFIVLFAFKAVQALIFAINMARARAGNYIFDLVMSIILIGLAILLIFYPMAGAVTMIYYLAITLLLYAAADIYMYIELLKLKRSVISE